MLKNKHIKLLLICMCVFVGLTIISRAADSITVAKVNAENPGRSALFHRTIVHGEIDASRKHFIRSAGASFRIEEIHVGQGSEVEEGELLFTLDMHYLAEQAEKLRIELSNLNLEIQKMRLENDGNNSSVSLARVELERAIAEDEFNKSINEGVQMVADRRKIEDAEKKLEDALRNSSRNNIDVEIRNNNRRQKQNEYDDISAILNNGGKIFADIAGTVGEIFVSPGQIGTSDNYCTIIPKDAHFLFIGEINAEAGAYLRTGDTVSVNLAGISRPVSNLTIKSLARDEGKARITADLPSDSGAFLGQSASLNHEKRSDEYRNVIPLAAVRGSAGDYYVYVVRDSRGVLGVQKTAARVPVNLIENDNQSVAIEGGFTNDDLIITRSNKSISEGDRVRVQSAEVRNR